MTVEWILIVLIILLVVLLWTTSLLKRIIGLLGDIKAKLAGQAPNEAPLDIEHVRRDDGEAYQTPSTMRHVQSLLMPSEADDEDVVLAVIAAAITAYEEDQNVKGGSDLP